MSLSVVDEGAVASEALLGSCALATRRRVGHVCPETVHDGGLAGHILAEIGQRVPPVQVVVACGLAAPSYNARLRHNLFEHGRICALERRRHRSREHRRGGRSRALHVDVVGGGRSHDLLLALSARLHLLVLSPDALLDAV